MHRRLAIVLSIVAANLLASLPVSAAKEERYSYCHGYIKKALGALPIEELDRRDMWLAWNVTVKKALIEGEVNKERYQAGRDDFSRQLASNNVAAMEDVVEGECELGQNPTWVWW
jgi:hypothetical protein